MVLRSSPPIPKYDESVIENTFIQWQAELTQMHRIWGSFLPQSSRGSTSCSTSCHCGCMVNPLSTESHVPPTKSEA